MYNGDVPGDLPLLARIISPQELALRLPNGAEESFRCADLLPNPLIAGFRVKLEGQGLALNVRLYPLAGTNELLIACTDRTAAVIGSDYLENLMNHVAHDLRNLFFTVSLQTEIASRNPSQAKPHLETILNQLTKVQRYLERLLLYGRKPVLARVPLDVEMFIREKLRALRATWPPDQSPLSFRITIDGTPGVALWDPIVLGYALEAVLDNAFRATPPRQEVVIHLQGKKDWVLIEVQDFGPGVPSEDLERVFVPMAVRRPHGLGLGLPTAQKLVQAHGGTIALSCSEGGTVVRFSLPRQPHAR